MHKIAYYPACLASLCLFCILGTVISCSSDSEQNSAVAQQPGIPSNLHQVDSKSEIVSLKWDESPDDEAVAYRIYRNGELLAAVEETQFSDRNIEASTWYLYTVSAYEISDPENESAQRSLKIQADSLNDDDAIVVAEKIGEPEKDITPPTIPSNIRIIGLSTEHAAFEWNKSVDNQETDLVKYRVYRNGELLSEVTGESFRDESVPIAGLYTYTFSSLDQANPPNESSKRSLKIRIPSNDSEVDNLSGEDSTDDDTKSPSIPSDLQLIEVSSESVTFAWDQSISAGSSALAGYLIYRDGELFAETNEPWFVDREVKELTTYYYAVASFDGATPRNESAKRLLRVDTGEF